MLYFAKFLGRNYTVDADREWFKCWSRIFMRNKSLLIRNTAKDNVPFFVMLTIYPLVGVDRGLGSFKRKRVAERPPPSAITSSSPSLYNCLSVRFTIYVRRKFAKNPSLGGNPRTN
jgi:hypothetical protein